MTVFLNIADRRLRGRAETEEQQGAAEGAEEAVYDTVLFSHGLDWCRVYRRRVWHLMKTSSLALQKWPFRQACDPHPEATKKFHLNEGMHYFRFVVVYQRTCVENHLENGMWGDVLRWVLNLPGNYPTPIRTTARFFEEVKGIQDLISKVKRNTERIDDDTNKLLNATTRVAEDQ